MDSSWEVALTRQVGPVSRPGSVSLIASAQYASRQIAASSKQEVSVGSGSSSRSTIWPSQVGFTSGPSVEQVSPSLCLRVGWILEVRTRPPRQPKKR